MTEKTFKIAEHVEQTAQLLDLLIAPDYLPSVIDNFARIANIAHLVTDFHLPEEIEAAPAFEP